jgi:hypothetical protein
MTGIKDRKSKRPPGEENDGAITNPRVFLIPVI